MRKIILLLLFLIPSFAFAKEYTVNPAKYDIAKWQITNVPLLQSGDKINFESAICFTAYNS